MDLDSATGACYDRARWYNSTNGTFLGRDPIESSANLYEYVGDDPLARTDLQWAVRLQLLYRREYNHGRTGTDEPAELEAGSGRACDW